MKIDIIIPTFNRAYVLERAIESVLLQSYQNFELYIVDDCSTDETSTLIKKYENDKRIHYLKHEKNLGVSSARNTGIDNSHSPFLAFLDSDDEWLSHKLQAQIDYFNERPEIPLVHGEEIWIRNGKRVNQRKIHKKSGGDIFIKSLKLCLISPSAAMIKRSVLLEMGNFDSEYTVCEDFDLWLKLTSLYEVGYIKEPLLKKYGGHEDQLSARYFAMDYFRVKSINNILNTRKLDLTKKEKALEEIIYKSRILIQGYKKHQNLENLKEIEMILSGCLIQLDSL